MNNAFDLESTWYSSRGRVYLLWAVITGVGFVTTHYYQDKNINFVWFLLSAVGFVYMSRVMPLKVRQMKQIYSAWLVPIAVGLFFSILAVRTTFIPDLVPYLGVFWLAISAVGYIWNGLVDKPAFWYFAAAALNIMGALLCYFVEEFTAGQYLVAAIISVWSMLNLFVFRSDG